MPYEIVQYSDDDIKKNASGKIIKEGEVSLNKGRLSVVIGGLFDYSIFGHPNTCYCQKVKIPGEYCPHCHTTVKTEADFRKSFAYYQLNVPYINVIRIKAFVDYLYEMSIPIGIPTRGKKGTDSLLKLLWSKTITISNLPSNTPDDKTDLYDKEGNRYKLTITDLEEKGSFDFGLCGLYQLSSYYNCQRKSLEGIKGFINYLLIITSPADRMYTKFNSGGKAKVILPRQNHLYKAVITMNSSLDNLMENNFTSEVDRATLCYLQNVLIAKCQEEESLIATSKESLIRNLVSTRVSESGRSTIVGDPNLPIDEIIIPESLAYQMLDQKILEGLRERGYIKDAHIKYRKADEDAMNVMYDLIEDCCATLVRNPSLHKFNMMSFKVRLTRDDIAIHIPILICSSYAADKLMSA
jgi:hypothetical protein